jgi:hypothetical protein
MKRYRIVLPNDYGSKEDSDIMVEHFMPEYWKSFKRLEERDKRESGFGNSYQRYYDLLRQRYQSEFDKLNEWAFKELHELWPGLELEDTTDFGGIFRTDTPMPDNLPCWIWVSSDEYPDDPDNTEWVKA